MADPIDQSGRRRRGRWRIWTLIVVLILVVAIGGWSDHEAGGYYAYSPGSAPQITTDASCKATSSGTLKLADGAPCAHLIIGGGHGHAITGKLLLVDVLVGKATPIQWLLHKTGLLNRFSKGTQLIPAPAVLGSTPSSQLSCEDTQDMQNAQSTAPLVALGRLGYKITSTNLGARVYLVLSGTAASRDGIDCDDLITSVGHTTVRTPTDLSRALAASHPGQTVAITVKRAGAHGTTTVTEHVTLGSVPALDGKKAQPKKAFLGVESVSDTVYHLPFSLRVEVGDIGGPSAGLALTLGFLDSLSGGHLTGGKVVAATGTISPNGAVGDVGGVAQKTLAVQRAGAVLFLVPDQEYATATAHASKGMKVVAVNSVSQALAAIKAIGGTIPPTSG